MIRKHHVFSAARWLRRLLVFSACTALTLLISLLVWARQIAAADPGARFALDSDEAVIVSREEWVTFRPRDADPTVGVVFYPGGKSEPAAYAPILRNLAARGFLIVMTPMPLNLALLAPERARKVMPRYAEIRKWVIAGHSLGGVMAAEFAERHVNEIAGLVLWASYPAEFTDLSRAPLPVLSVFGTADTLTTTAEVDSAGRLLPESTRYVRIEGGGHWNFGDFLSEPGEVVLSRDQQQAITLDATQEFLDGIAAGPDEGHRPVLAPAPRSLTGVP